MSSNPPKKPNSVIQLQNLCSYFDAVRNTSKDTLERKSIINFLVGSSGGKYHARNWYKWKLSTMEMIRDAYIRIRNEFMYISTKHYNNDTLAVYWIGSELLDVLAEYGTMGDIISRMNTVVIAGYPGKRSLRFMTSHFDAVSLYLNDPNLLGNYYIYHTLIRFPTFRAFAREYRKYIESVMRRMEFHNRYFSDSDCRASFKHLNGTTDLISGRDIKNCRCGAKQWILHGGLQLGVDQRCKFKNRDYSLFTYRDDRWYHRELRKLSKTRA